MKILLVRPDGIGDEISCLPVASALRDLIPGSRISFLSSPYASPIFEHLPIIDEVLTMAHGQSIRTLMNLFNRDFDAAIFLKPYRRIMLAAFYARVPLRVATGYRWYSFLANRRVYQHRKDFSQHETEYNLGLLSGLGLTPKRMPPPELVLSSQEKEWAYDRLSVLPSPRVVLHPGGFAARRWKSQHYFHLANRLVGEGFGVILTGNEQEKTRFFEEISGMGNLHPSVMELMGQLTLRQLMAVIGAGRVVVSGATGPAHLAAALGVRTVSLFDPRRNNLPIRWKPLGNGVVLRPDVPTCEKCVYEGCPYWDCLDRITVEHVCGQIHAAFDPISPVEVVHV